MMGGLARQDEYLDPMSGLPTGGVMPEPPQQVPPDPRFAMGALAHPVRFEPGVGMWPAYKPPKELPDVGEPMIPSGPRWEGNPTANRATDVMGQLAIQSVVPQDPLDAGLMLATGPGRVGYKLAAGAIGAIMNPDEAEAGSLNKLIKGIRAFHSSPHDFDKFDLAKIGTGEGAQVYGHGLYFAENPAVSGQGGQYWTQFSNRFRGPENVALETLRLSKFDREAAIEQARRALAKEQEALRTGHYVPGNPATKMDADQLSWHPALIEKQQEALRMLESGKPVGPRTYEVNIKADPVQFLDWDKPLREQPEVYKRIANIPQFQATEAITGSGERLLDVAKAHGVEGLVPVRLQKMLGQGHTLQSAFDILKDTPGGTPKWLADVTKLEADLPRNKFEMRKAVPDHWEGARIGQGMYGVGKVETSDLLREAGVPGIKYLDQGSRTNVNVNDIRGSLSVWENALKKAPKDEYAQSQVSTLRQQLAAAEKGGSSNYVVFDPSIIDIMKKYGIAGAAPAGMGALAAQDYYRGD